MYTLVSEGPTHRFAAVRNVLVTLYWAAPTSEALMEREPWVREAHEKYEGFGLLVVVDARASGVLPDGDFRAASKRQALLYGDKMLVSASAIEGDGLTFKLLRTFLRALALVVNPKFPVRSFATVQEAAAFAVEACAEHEGPSVSELLQVVSSIRPVTLPNAAPTQSS